jgi:general secretion pathway protein B
VVQAVAPAPVIAPPVVAPPPVFAPQTLASASAGSPASAAAMATSPRPAPRPAVRRESVPATPVTPAAPPAAPPGDRIYSLAELPEAIRRELPKLTYGGGSYSGDKASRLAFLNGQVFHEGDTVAPGLVLKQVKQKGVILAYKGYRFEVGP